MRWTKNWWSSEKTAHHRLERFERERIVRRVKGWLIPSFAKQRCRLECRMTAIHLARISVAPEMMPVIYALKYPVMEYGPAVLLGDIGAQNRGGK